MRMALPLNRRGIALLLCWAVCLPGPAARAEPGQDADQDTSDQQLIKELEALRQATAEPQDLSARFTQRRYSPLLKKPIESSGVVRSVIGLTRWDTDKPQATSMIVRPDRLELYDPEQKTLEVYPIESRLGQLLANPRPDPKDWQSQFTIQRAKKAALSESMRERCELDDDADGYLLISLTPRDEAVAKHVERLIIVLDTETGLSRGMAWSSGEGERTEIVFASMRVDTGLTEKDLRLKTPDSVRVVYPLGPVPEREKKPD